MSEQPAEQEAQEQNPSALSAAAQGSNVPLGWKPTIEHPVPVVRCTQIKKDGERCGRWSLRGASNGKCIKHNGNGGFPNVETRAKAVIESARLRMLDETDRAIDVLVELSQPGTAEAIRLKSATEILDRAGIRGGFEVSVEMEITESPADAIRARIEELRKGAAAAEKMKADKELDIVDAELVDEDQPSLFDMPDEEHSDDTD